MPTPQQIAAWRFDVIAPFIDRSFDRVRRRAAMREITRHGVAGPAAGASNGRARRISRSTLFRWIKKFRKHGLKGLEPTPPPTIGAVKRKDAAAWVHRGIQLLCEQPERSLTQIEKYLSIEFKEYDLSRASLHRHLRAHPAFRGIQALRRRHRKSGLRGSYEASRPHECWQLDGKGPFDVRLVDGTVVRLHVLSVIDDYSRAILAALVTTFEDTKGATLVIQTAIELFGLPDRMQFDRGSAFDSEAFRDGLANLGIHRNAMKPRNPEADGKIEAYHRSLIRWFIKELPVQEVVDREHLQQLLDAMIAVLYNRHRHREIKSTPQARLAGQVSDRRVALKDLKRAFFVETTAISHKKTGQVKLKGGTFQWTFALSWRSRDARQGLNQGVREFRRDASRT